MQLFSGKEEISVNTCYIFLIRRDKVHAAKHKAITKQPVKKKASHLHNHLITVLRGVLSLSQKHKLPDTHQNKALICVNHNNSQIASQIISSEEAAGIFHKLHQESSIFLFAHHTRSSLNRGVASMVQRSKAVLLFIF